MKNSIETVTVTKLEKEFIFAYYRSVSSTLNFSRLNDVVDCMDGVTIEQAKGVLGSLVSKGFFDPCADIDDNTGRETMATTGNIPDSVYDEIAKEKGCRFDFEDLDYDYIKFD